MQHKDLDIKRTFGPAVRLAWIFIAVMLFNSNFCFGISEEKEYEAAWQLCQSGRYSEASEAFKKYLSRHPKGKFIPEARFTLARIEMSGNNAFGHYQFILDNYPTHPLASQAAYATAQYLQNVGSGDQAKERYLLTYSRYSNTVAGKESLFKLALIALGHDSVSSAEAYIKAYIDQYPKAVGGAALLNKLGDYRQKRGEEEKAKECWQNILDFYPGTPESGNAREMLISYLSQQDQEDDAGTSDLSPAGQTGDVVNLPEPTPVPKPSNTNQAVKLYYLQIGAYKSTAILDSWAKKIEAQGFETVVDQIKDGKGVVYKLQVGPYYNTSELKSAERSLKDKFGLKTMVVEK